MQGQISDDQFRMEYPKAQVDNGERTATTRYGKSTVNYWVQHKDYSWTNYDCRTQG